MHVQLDLGLDGHDRQAYAGRFGPAAGDRRTGSIGAVPDPVTQIAPVPLTSPDAQALIARLDADLAARYPDPADVHSALAVEEVAGDTGVFLVATVAGEPVGCGALRQIAPG